MRIETSVGSKPTTTSLMILPEKLGEISLLVLKVSYATEEQALAAELNRVFCTDPNITLDSSTIIKTSDIRAVVRSGTIYLCKYIFKTFFFRFL